MLTGDRPPPTSYSGMPSKEVFFEFNIDLFLLVWTPASVVTGVESERGTGMSGREGREGCKLRDRHGGRMKA